MIIQNIEKYQAINIKTEPSAGVDSSELRTNLINTVKQRINSGYYNSTEVLDDLIDTFATALNKLSDSG